MPLPVTAEQVATALGIRLTDSAHRGLVTAAVEAAIADVEAFLGRAITPRTYTEEHRWPIYGGWSLTPLDYPVREITSAVPETVEGEPTGYYTVTYLAGLDCTEPDKAPIRRYLIAAASTTPTVVRLWNQLRTDDRTVTSLSVEGQSVGYASPAAELGGGGVSGSGLPGSLPSLRSLSRWRIAGRRVYTRPGATDAWPYGGATFTPADYRF